LLPGFDITLDNPAYRMNQESRGECTISEAADGVRVRGAKKRAQRIRAAALLLPPTDETAMPTLAPWPYPRLIAHRGGGRLAPENTLAAMRVGAGMGFGMVEFDVKLSRDDVPFLLHDDTVDRTTDGHGAAAAMTFGELALLDAGAWHSPAFAGEPLPTLRAVARQTLAAGVASNVEIKPCPGCDRETGARVALAVRELWRGATPPPLLSSFSETALAAARAAAPELPRALLLEDFVPDWDERLQRHGCIALHLDQRKLTADIAARVRDAGYRLAAYTVNDPVRARNLREWGVDSIFTDALDTLGPATPSSC